MRDNDLPAPSLISVRQATVADIPAIEQLATLAVQTLLRPFLDEAAMAETDDFTHIDPWYIEDGTYFLLEIDGAIRGSGGFSRRPETYHREAASNGSVHCLDPARDAARIRAMYTHPEFAQKGVGRTLLSISEISARLRGFRRLQLTATPSGEPLYRSAGYSVISREYVLTRSNLPIPVANMAKAL